MSSTRNNIAILNEISQKQNMKITYVYKSIGNVHNPLFQCVCQFGNYKYVAEGTSKKTAKELCANEILLKFELNENVQIKEHKVVEPAIQENYVGLLNEFCSKNRLQYADYTQDTHCNEYLIKCYVNELESVGLSMNKKEAKQISAKKMLKLLKSNELPKVKETVPQNILKDEEIVEQFEKLRLKSQIKQKETKMLSNVSKEILSDFNVTILQTHPLIISGIQIDDESVTYIATGKTSDEAYEKLALNIYADKSLKH